MMLMNQKRLRSAIFLLLFGCVSSSIAPAQFGKKERLLGDGCEIISGKLDAVGDMYKSARSESFLILIGSYSGDQKYAFRTIDDAQRYLIKFYKVEKEKLKIGIFPSGDKRSQIEFFINGESVATIDTTNHRRLCFGIGDMF